MEQVDKQVQIKGLYKNSFLHDLSRVFGNTAITEIPLFFYAQSRFFDRVYGLTSHYFYTPELYFTFKRMYEVTKNSNYSEVCDLLSKNTWLKSTLVDPPEVDLSILKNMNITLSDYQLEFVQKYFKYKQKYQLHGMYNAFEQGLGKSLCSIAVSMIVGKQVIIICPKSLSYNWIGEFQKAFTPEYIAKHKMKIGVVGDHKPDNDYTHVICSYERVNKAYDYVHKGAMIIIDEAQNVRFDEINRSQEIFKLKNIIECTDVLPMSGTPVKARANEIVPMLRLLDPKFDDQAKDIFNKIYSVHREYAYELLRYRLSFTLDRVGKDRLDLPEKKIINVKFKVKDPQPFLISQIKQDIRVLASQYYKELLGEQNNNLQYLYNCFRLLADDYGVYTKDEIQLIRELLLQFQRSPVLCLEDPRIGQLREAYEKGYRWLTNHKYLKTRERFREAYMNTIGAARVAAGRATNLYHVRIIEAIHAWASENKTEFIKLILDGKKKTILFTTKLAVVEWMQQFLETAGLQSVKVTGATKNVSDTVLPFRNDPNVRCLIATIQKLNSGITLTEANQVIFLDLPYRSAEFEQASDRAHRRGQDTIVYIFKMFIDTGDEPNITTHSKEIMDWSAQLAHEFLGEDEPDAGSDIFIGNGNMTGYDFNNSISDEELYNMSLE